jgi:2-dehydro-3-deoxy-D-gluconate 5-dehydrogenase
MNVLDQFRLDDRIALVTGANRGLGQAMALGLAEAGAHVAGLNRSQDDGGTGEQVQALGRRYLHIPMDLLETDNGRAQEIIQQVTTHYGRLDILVNNAGIIRRASALDFTEGDWDAVLQVNLRAAFLLAQAAARVMMQQGSGKIINVASMLSYQGGIRVLAYTAAKHGLIGLTRALATELAAHNINVNAIAPGYMVTDNTAVLRADQQRNAEITGRIPAERWGQPEELKGATVFLASSAADYVHGAVIDVDGGWLAR